MAKAAEPITTRKKVVAFRDSIAHPYDRLPFVITPPGGPRDFWAPRPSGDYNADCDLGQQYAEATIPMMRGDPYLLGFIVLGILEQGDKSRDRGLIVGLMGAISKRLIIGPARQLRAVRALAAEDMA